MEIDRNAREYMCMCWCQCCHFYIHFVIECTKMVNSKMYKHYFIAFVQLSSTGLCHFRQQIVNTLRTQIEVKIVVEKRKHVVIGFFFLSLSLDGLTFLLANSSSRARVMCKSRNCGFNSEFNSNSSKAWLTVFSNSSGSAPPDLMILVATIYCWKMKISIN